MRSSVRIVIAVLALVVAFSPIASAATASTAFTDVPVGTVQATNFALLNVLDIFRGYGDGRVGPNDLLTREQFSVIVIRMLGKSDEANALASRSSGFSDDRSLASWARGAVIYAKTHGIVNGYPDGSFKPQGSLTGVEAYAMLARALGLDDAAKGEWPTNYVSLASQTGLSIRVDMSPDLPLKRYAMAQMVMNALNMAFEVNAHGDLIQKGDSGFSGTQPIIDASISSGVLDIFNDDTLRVGTTTYNRAQTLYLFGAAELRDLLDIPVTIVFDNEDNVAVVTPRDLLVTRVYAGKFDDTDRDGTGGGTITLQNETEVRYDAETTFALNGKVVTPKTLEPDDNVTINVEGGVARYVDAIRWDLPNAVVVNITDHPDKTRTLDLDTTGDLNADASVVLNTKSVVHINDVPSAAEDVEQYDVVDVASRWAMVQEVHQVDVTRSTVHGTVDYTSSVDTGGSVYNNVVLTDGTHIRLDEHFDGTLDPVKGARVRYALNSMGRARHDLKDAQTEVKVSEVSVISSGQRIIVDEYGARAVYSDPEVLVSTAAVGTAATITLDPDTGALTSFNPTVVDFSSGWTVTSVDAAGDVVAIKRGTTTKWLTDPPVYAESGTTFGIGDYIGVEGLGVGDTVYTDSQLSVLVRAQ